MTGKYLGAAHNACNLNRKSMTNIPMFCHNLSGYDSHFLVQAVGGNSRIKKLTGLPLNSEKFRTITINSYHLLDSLSFLQASLGELVNDLTRDPSNQFLYLDQTGLYPVGDDKKKKLLLRKGVYPYEAVRSLSYLKKTKQIPPLRDFYSSLTDKTISQEDYSHAKDVFESFQCEDMLAYTMLYVISDTILLCECFQQFRETVLKDFHLDCW